MNAAEVKLALNERAEAFTQWLFPAGRKEANHWRVGSISGEKGHSLGICITGSKVGVFKDFATDEGGDNLVELLAQTRRLKFKDALHECADWLGVIVTAAAGSVSPHTESKLQASPNPVPMSDGESAQALTMAARLRDDPALCERIARARGWRAETIAELTWEPSLGWHDGKLAFLYESGVKLRWRENDERIIRWAFGKPWLWRGGYLWDSSRPNVYLTEGETDAISLVDAGVESDRATLVVAVPSASTFNESWAQLFQGKHVVLALDGDKTGQEATTRISRFLQRFVKSLRQVNWEGLQRAS